MKVYKQRISCFTAYDHFSRALCSQLGHKLETSLQKAENIKRKVKYHAHMPNGHLQTCMYTELDQINKCKLMILDSQAYSLTGMK